MSRERRVEGKRSPLSGRLLRNPGQSLEEQIETLSFDKLMPLFVIAVVASVLAGLEWWRAHAGTPPQPALFTSLAILLAAYAALKWGQQRGHIENLRLRVQGEREVAQRLEADRKEGWRVFNDIPGSGFNVDHVLIAPQGVFVIETKTVSKPRRGDVVVMFEGERVLVNGFEPDRNPLTQARAGRDWIRSLLEEPTGRRFPVKAVVLFPGWFIERSDAARGSDVWVLNPKALAAFVTQEPVVLPPEDVALVGSRLVDYVAGWDDRPG